MTLYVTHSTRDALAASMEDIHLVHNLLKGQDLGSSLKISCGQHADVPWDVGDVWEIQQKIPFILLRCSRL
jgi:hypothetical protein